MRTFLAAATLALVALTGPAGAHEQSWPVGGPVVFVPDEAATLELWDSGSYRGSLELRASGGTLTVVNELDIESYLKGLAEVPGRWPMEALKAQAVAARTYALWERYNGGWASQGFEICATVSCQVYVGTHNERGSDGARWTQAVEATQGEVLLHAGRPALTRYHASSGGQTLANDFVFPSSGSRPYLVSVDDAPDTASPLHTWEVRFTREAMAAILREGLDIPGDIESIDNDQQARRVRIRTASGETQMPTPRFRRAVSDHAPRLYGDLYPAPRADGLRMPLTLPSSRFDVESDDSSFLIRGRGYGHGVGMSQWGAKGRADRGDDYHSILEAYYPGLELSVYGGSSMLRVGIRTGADSAMVSADGPFAVHAGDEQLSEPRIGRWTVEARGGSSVHVRPPDGFELPLVLSGLDVPDVVQVDVSDPRPELRVSFVLPKPARVEATLRRDGATISSAANVFEAGEARLLLPVAEARELPDGRYQLALTASDGQAEANAARDVVIETVGAGGQTPAGIAAGLGLLALTAFIVWRRRARTLQGGRSATVDVPETAGERLESALPGQSQDERAKPAGWPAQDRP